MLKKAPSHYRDWGLRLVRRPRPYVRLDSLGIGGMGFGLGIMAALGIEVRGAKTGLNPTPHR
ncbi:MAG: hypothetical protein RLZZ597_1542 [Cyanobacteriota bacterium]|jgi:hypothetical protein